ncbi:MAG TPA: hypothetical protein VHB68_10495 [Steroidobacteraceae bacterium]|nr:hypothetical protein [Steroidobacteraceae bacterium]
MPIRLSWVTFLLPCLLAWQSSPAAEGGTGSCGELSALQHEAALTPASRTVHAPPPSYAPSTAHASTPAPTGSEFARQIAGLDDDERESAILEQALAGNFPDFLRHLEPVTLTSQDADGTPLTLTLCVAPDYLAVGSDSDYLFVPMRLKTAINVASHYGAVLPTRKIVDAIYAQARVHLRPQPLPAGATMRTTAYYWRHSELIRQQRLSFDSPLGVLTAGDKKDLVLTNRSWAYLERVAIYGWHLPDGRPIQPLSTLHGARYADYSHGVRLVGGVAYVNGAPAPLLKLLEDPRLGSLLSYEGVIRRPAELLRQLAAAGYGSAAAAGARRKT